MNSLFSVFYVSYQVMNVINCKRRIFLF